MPGGGKPQTQQQQQESSSSSWTCGSDWTIEITNNDNGDKQIYNVHRNKLIRGNVTAGYFQRLFESATFASEHQDCTSRITLPSSEQAEAFPIFLDFLYEKEKLEVEDYFYYVTLSELGDYFEIQGLEKGSFMKQGCLSCMAHVKRRTDVVPAVSFCNLAVSSISHKGSDDVHGIASLVAFMFSSFLVFSRSHLLDRIRAVPTSLLAVTLPLVRLQADELLESFENIVDYVERCLSKNTDEIPVNFFCTSFSSILEQLEDVSITPRKANKLQYAKEVIEVCLNYLDLDCQYSPVNLNLSISSSQKKIIGIIRSFQDKRKTMMARFYEIYREHRDSKEYLASLTRHCPNVVMLELLE